MKVSEALEHMTKSFLHRLIDSFTRDLPKPDEEKAREIILRNSEELTDPERIRTGRGVRRVAIVGSRSL